MQRIMDITRWFKLDPEQQMEFELVRPRAIRIEVNAPAETQLSFVSEDGEVNFLALVKGRDTVEFEAKASFSLMTDQPNTFIYSASTEMVHRIVEAPESYTRVLQGRRQRNPELEFITQQMNRNFERQMAKQARAYGDLLERSLASREAQSAPSRPAPGAAQQPEPDADAGTASEVAGVDGGNKTGKGVSKPD